MAGYKHGRSGAYSEGSGSVRKEASSSSALASQLQQAWMQTQMPKIQKRTFTSVPSSRLKNVPSSTIRGMDHKSALKSLSAIFPEIVDMPEETKPMIYSVFQDGEEPEPIPQDLKKRRERCLEFLFQNVSLSDRPAPTPVINSNGNSKPKFTSRSISEPLSTGGSGDFISTGGVKPFTYSHSFSGIAGYGTASDDNLNPNPSQQVALTAKTEEKAPLFSYLSDILMEENVEESKCMFMEMSAYQVMAKELGDLIGDDDDNLPSLPSTFFPKSEEVLTKELEDLIGRVHHSPPDSYVDYTSNNSTAFNDSSEVTIGGYHEHSPSSSYSSDYGVSGGHDSSNFSMSNVDHSEDLADTQTVDEWIEKLLSGPLPVDQTPSPSYIKAGDIDSADHMFRKDIDAEVSGGLSNVSSSHSISSGSRSSSQGWEDVESDQVVESMKITSYSGRNNSFAFASPARNKEIGVVRKRSWSKPIIPPVINSNNISPVDLPNLLIRCAEAVERADFQQANELIDELRQQSSAYGNGSQRMAHYFMEALVARMSGTGAQLYTALSRERPSEAQMLKGFRLFYGHVPFIHIAHIFANDTILQAFEGASRVHIVDYGILYGQQWPCLLSKLARRPGGPPHVRITGIDRPQPGFRPSARIQETGRRLAKLAKFLGVPFEFHAIAEKWDAITPAHLMLRDDEVLAVNCMFRLRHTLDETVTAASPRTTLLNRIRSMNPKVFTQGLINSAHNSPFFMSRFRSALSYFSLLFDALETSMPTDHPDRHILDQDIFGREILNVVACEGLERVERAEPYRQWQSRTLRSGFQQLPLNPEIIDRIKANMKSYDRNYGMGEDGSWFLTGWKGHIMHAFGAWEPAPAASP